MLTAGRTLRRGVDGGVALPDVTSLRDLHGAGVRFRRGQVVMVTGRPGAGKSNLMQHLVTCWARAGVPILYYSLDMDPWTTGIRQAAAVTGHSQDRIVEAMDTLEGEAQYEAALADVDVVYCFDTRPALPDVQEELDAFVELRDEWPGVIVIDNLLNIDTGGEGGHADYKFAMKELQGLARETGATVFILHHAREGVKDTTRPPTMAETDNKMNQIPEVILGVAHDDNTGEMSIAALKVRSGAKSDPGAERPFRLAANFSTMSFSKPQRTGWVAQAWDQMED
jgi:hypothetical protein